MKNKIAVKLLLLFLISVSITLAIAIAINISSNRGEQSITLISVKPDTTTRNPITTVQETILPETSSKVSTPVITQAATSCPVTSCVTTVVTTVPVVTTEAVTTYENPNFVLDLSDYEKYMNPSGEDWSDDYLILVNADNKIGKDEELTRDGLNNIVSSDVITEYNYSRFLDFKLNECALKALTAMVLEAKAEGIPNLYVVSAYRDYSFQDRLFNGNVKLTYHWMCEECNIDWIGKDNTCSNCGNKATKTLSITKEEKEKNVATYSCRPGTSDHQTGLVVDIVQTSLPSKYLHLIQEFGDTDAGKWLAENCTKFGFILRFPEDKEDITGIVYEPWHFRFVGRYHAEKMKELNMCLEEYTEYLSQLEKS
jgi:LAS superfamily LD-carboxypeptidase LdcB